MDLWVPVRITRLGIFVIQAYAFHCVGRGGAGVPNRLLWRRLFEQSEFLSHLIRDGGGGTPENLVWQDRRGRVRAKMVLVTFAETKVTRRVGTKPHINNVQKGNGKRLLIGKMLLKKSRKFRLFDLPFSRQ